MNNDESNEYLFDTIRLQAISKLLGQLDTSMIDAFEQSQQLLSKLNNNETWRGEFRNQFIAFYNLLLQYHGQLCGKTAKSIGECKTASAEMDPIKKIYDAVEKLVDDIKELPNNSEGYRELKEVMK